MLKEPLRQVPPRMRKWNLRLIQSRPTQFGKFAIVKIEPCPTELHHIVRVIDEDGDDLTGVRVIFGYPKGGGQPIHRGDGADYWPEGPEILNGNPQHTLAGLARHTLGTGGEDIWIHHVEENGDTELSSDIVKNCTRVEDINLHTGVMVTFQRQRTDVVSQADQLYELVMRVKALEAIILNPPVNT